MTTPTLTAPETIQCGVCEQQVGPTTEGGTRPRPHNDREGKPCTGAQAFELPRCGRCGGGAYEPRNGCRSRTYHPERWTETVVEIGDDGVPVAREVEVGNIAAAGEIVGVAGQQYGWLTRLKDEFQNPLPPDNPRVAPAPIGIRKVDRVPYFDLDKVRKYTQHRPGPGAPGRPRRRSVRVGGAPDAR